MEVEEDSVRIESSEPEASTVVSTEEENSMSILNEGFVIDSELLSMTASNIEDSSRSRLVVQSNVVGETEESAASMELEDNTEFMEEEELLDEPVVPESPAGDSADNNDNTENPEDSRPLEIDLDDDDDDEGNENSISTQLPIHRIKKIMKICLATTEEEEPEPVNPKAKKNKNKGKGGPMMINKEAMYLTTLATEYFISAIGEMAGRLTVSSKKKTMTMEHLKRVLSDSESFDFLQGCLNPSVIIGD